ncbi:ras-related protein Rab-7L1 isoform X2 [Pelodiscus sinensis]|uniref:ras-related protein Rab-7L1 isoform X2 n=1 Tax=Pelodiscus sinensis TaxID=13735 RepID=UPI003F6BC194
MKMGHHHDHMFKVLIVGDATVGKTSLVQRYANDSFNKHYKSTVGGQERFTSMTRLYYREASACVIMFDVTNFNTFSNSQKWKLDLDSKLTLPDGSPVPCLLLANKCDLSPWAVTREEIDRFSKENGFSGWTETSVKENKNINESMRVLIEKMMSSFTGDGDLPGSGRGDYINIKDASPPGWGCC